MFFISGIDSGNESGINDSVIDTRDTLVSSLPSDMSCYARCPSAYMDAHSGSTTSEGTQSELVAMADFEETEEERDDRNRQGRVREDSHSPPLQDDVAKFGVGSVHRDDERTVVCSSLRNTR